MPTPAPDEVSMTGLPASTSGHTPFGRMSVTTMSPAVTYSDDRIVSVYRATEPWTNSVGRADLTMVRSSIVRVTSSVADTGPPVGSPGSGPV